MASRSYKRPNALDPKSVWGDDDLINAILCEIEGAEKVEIWRTFDTEFSATVAVWIEHEALKDCDDDRAAYGDKVMRLVEIGRHYGQMVKVVIKDSRDD